MKNLIWNNFIGKLIHLEYLLTPIASENYCYRENGAFMGYTYIYLFGIRVITIQRNQPWVK